MTKPKEKTREELQAEIEDGKKKIRQFENREKTLRQKLSKEKRRTRSHRLIVRGAFILSCLTAFSLRYGHLIIPPTLISACFFGVQCSSSLRRTSMRGSPLSLWQPQGPSLRFLPHCGHRPLQSSRHRYRWGSSGRMSLVASSESSTHPFSATRKVSSSSPFTLRTTVWLTVRSTGSSNGARQRSHSTFSVNR